MAVDDNDRMAEDAHQDEMAERAYHEELSMGCFAMIRETLAALDQNGYDGKATPPMMLNDWAAVIIARDRKRISELETMIASERERCANINEASAKEWDACAKQARQVPRDEEAYRRYSNMARALRQCAAAIRRGE